jgi:transcriptional antiterminator RfaH
MAVEDKWYLVQLKPNGFKRAVINLERQGLVTFMPMTSKRLCSGKGYYDKTLPLFPGYIFISAGDTALQWRSINSTFGVKRAVAFGDQAPKQLPEQLVSGLKLRCDKEDYLLPPTDLKIGEQVKIISGPFADYIATVETLPSTTRLGILFDCLGWEIPAKVNVENIQRLSI